MDPEALVKVQESCLQVLTKLEVCKSPGISAPSFDGTGSFGKSPGGVLPGFDEAGSL